MSVTNGPRRGLMINALTGDSFDVDFRKFLRAIDALLMGNVLSKTLSTPPGSPANGDAYIVAPTGTGAWAGHDNAMALWTTDNPLAGSGEWEFYAAANGMLVYNVADTTLYYWNGTAWTAPSGGGGGAVSSVAGRTGAVVLGESDITSLVADLAATEKTANKDAANGYAGLDSGGRLKPSEFPQDSTAGHGGFWGATVDVPVASISTGADASNNNRLYVDEFTLWHGVTVRKISIDVTGAVASSHISVGIYDSAGNLMLDSGQFDCSTTGVKTATLGSPVVLPPGIYYFAYIFDDITVGTLFMTTGPWVAYPQLWNANAVRHGYGANTWSGGSLPSTLGTLTALGPGNTYPILAFFEP